MNLAALGESYGFNMQEKCLLLSICYVGGCFSGCNLMKGSVRMCAYARGVELHSFVYKVGYVGL